ncbi:MULTISPECIES: LuxR C-terminal-related transcriptional regulator [unclassified Ornithinimicrobium]|uniref:LuxR C-terminal-related transcriptional regulator n=1 Tax=unclassified Ornithinimicrobium TaxID=2615080 RepID=UPI0038550CBA
MSAQLSPVAFHDSRLSVPAPAEDAVERSRLTTRLEQAIQRHHVTLVTGAGGTGKTYAVAMWSRSLASREGPVVVAWASLDRADGDPHRYWLTVVGALQRVVDSEEVAGLVVPSRPNQHFVDSLAAALAGVSSQLVLVLDDVHELAGSQALEALEALQRCLPRRHRLVLISRHDPPLHLHRLRLSGDLGELRAAELAFTPNEAAELLHASGLELPDGALDHLMATTEGWAAGLRLATVAIEPASDPTAVVTRFSGRHALVSAYLLEEVVAGLGPDRADFLLRTSVADRVCAPLARALTDEESAGAVLESLVADNVLVSALEDTGWYRYHPMLLEMLRARLRAASPDQAADLHRRAQHWFEDSGEWLEALHHATLGGDDDLAAQLALRSAAVLVFTPERVRLAQVLAPLTGAPAHPGDPERQLCHALAAYGVGDDEATLTWIRRAGPGLAVLPEPRKDIATIVQRLLLTAQARRQGDPHLMLSAAQDALGLSERLTPSASKALPQLQGVATSMIGVGELWRGRPGRAEELLRSVVVGVDNRTLGVYAQVYHGGLLALSEMSRGHVQQGLRRAETVLEAARVSGWSQSYESGAAWLVLAIGGLYRADLLEAERCLTLARQTQIGVRDPFLGAVMDLVATRSALTAGDLPRARRALASVDRWVAERPRLTLITIMRGALDAEIQLAAGAAQGAAAVIAELDAHLADLGEEYGTEQDPVAITRAHVLLATGRTHLCEDAVAPLLQADGVISSEAWLVTALAQDRLRQDASAMESLGRALAHGAAEDAIQGFLRRNDRLPLLLRRHLDVLGTHRPFAERVLTRIDQGIGAGHGRTTHVTGPVALTERELSVLAYLPTLSTNPEIADELSISVNTVKQHLKTINRKLEVSSRREAVRAARRLGLLPEPS